jgi:hypothetical protein
MAHANSQQWIRRCILEASEEDREYGVATVLGPTWVDRSGEIYCNLIDRTHCIGCVLTAAALEYSVSSNWTETLDGALVLVEAASLVLNQDKKQFNLRVATFQMMRTSTGRDPENVISCFVMDDPEVKRAYEQAMASCTRPFAPPPPPPAEESFLDRSRRSYPMACAAFPVQPEGGTGDFSILPQMLHVPPDQQRQLDALMRAHTASVAPGDGAPGAAGSGQPAVAQPAAQLVTQLVTPAAAPDEEVEMEVVEISDEEIGEERAGAAEPPIAVGGHGHGQEGAGAVEMEAAAAAAAAAEAETEEEAAAAAAEAAMEVLEVLEVLEEEEVAAAAAQATPSQHVAGGVSASVEASAAGSFESDEEPAATEPGEPRRAARAAHTAHTAHAGEDTTTGEAGAGLRTPPAGVSPVLVAEERSSQPASHPGWEDDRQLFSQAGFSQAGFSQAGFSQAGFSQAGFSQLAGPLTQAPLTQTQPPLTQTQTPPLAQTQPPLAQTQPPPTHAPRTQAPPGFTQAAHTQAASRPCASSTAASQPGGRSSSEGGSSSDRPPLGPPGGLPPAEAGASAAGEELGSESDADDDPLGLKTLDVLAVVRSALGESS